MNSMAMSSSFNKVIGDVIVRKNKREKTPEGSYRFNEKVYAIRLSELRKKLFCGKCKKENADLAGTFRDDDGNINFVVKCPDHPDERYHLNENQFRKRFPGVLPEHKNSLYGPDGLPKVRSYCRECRGTTGNVIGETETHYEIQCACGQHWMENKKAFAQKYLGVDGKLPDFEQREPQERSWKDKADGSEIRQMQDLLKMYNVKKESKETKVTEKTREIVSVTEEPTEETKKFSEIKEEITETVCFSEEEKTENEITSEKEKTMAEEKNEIEMTPEKEEHFVTFDVAGIKVTLSESAADVVSFTVRRVDGMVHVIIK